MWVNSRARFGGGNLISFRYRKSFGIALGCAVLGVAIWHVGKSPENRGSSASPRTSSASPGAPKGSNPVFVSPLPADTKSATLRTIIGIGSGIGANNDLGLFGETARSLVRSNVLAKIDYGQHRAYMECTSLASGVDGNKLVKESVLPQRTDKNRDSYLHYGYASEEARLAGFSRSLERCRKIFEGARLSPEETLLIRALPKVKEYEIIRATLREANDFEESKTKVALVQAVTEPMFGALASLLINKLDYSELAKFYGETGASSLQNLVFELVLCRMGDDCGRGGIVTEQLCWESGICGEYTEEAIWTNLRDRGLDTTALNQFVTRVHQALLSGDTSIFRKPKPSK